MIFCRDLVTCDDFGDCLDEIAVASADFIGRRPNCGHYQQGVLLGTPKEDNYSGSSISSPMVVKRKSSLEVMNLHPMLYPMMQLVMFFH
jgi:hypothetical protein